MTPQINNFGKKYRRRRRIYTEEFHERIIYCCNKSKNTEEEKAIGRWNKGEMEDKSLGISEEK